jgi:hypothetical protein
LINIQSCLLALIVLGCSERRTEKSVETLSIGDSINSQGGARSIEDRETREHLQAGLGIYFKLDSLLNAGDTASANQYFDRIKTYSGNEFPYAICIQWYKDNGPYSLRSARNLVKFLIDHGVDPNKKVNMTSGECNVTYAYPVSCDTIIAGHLMRGGSKYQSDQWLVCAGKDLTSIKSAIKKGANPTYALLFAHRYHKEYFEELLESKIAKDAAMDLACGRYSKYRYLNYNLFYSGNFDYSKELRELQDNLTYDTLLIRNLINKGFNPTIPLRGLLLLDIGIFLSTWLIQELIRMRH